MFKRKCRRAYVGLLVFPTENGHPKLEEVKKLSSGYGDRPRKMYKIICSDCGKEAEVPFKPTEGRPVYCKECFQKHRKY